MASVPTWRAEAIAPGARATPPHAGPPWALGSLLPRRHQAEPRPCLLQLRRRPPILLCHPRQLFDPDLQAARLLRLVALHPDHLLQELFAEGLGAFEVTGARLRADLRVVVGHPPVELAADLGDLEEHAGAHLSSPPAWHPRGRSPLPMRLPRRSRCRVQRSRSPPPE